VFNSAVGVAYPKFSNYVDRPRAQPAPRRRSGRRGRR
jgi:hypothetical protein